MRAMVPSSFMISQITPAGVSPARRARSTEPSVCPVRTNTPPRRARSGNTWPGLTRSSGPEDGSTAVRMVWERSWALMPVVTPLLASMDTVKAVSKGDLLSRTMGVRPRRSAWSGMRLRQMRPRPWVAMKLMASGVTISAAMVRSPSFSRSSSSTRMTILPLRISSMASSMLATGMMSSLRPPPCQRGPGSGGGAGWALKVQFEFLLDDASAPLLHLVLFGQGETSVFIQAPGRIQPGEGPQKDLAMPRLAGELQAAT